MGSVVSSIGRAIGSVAETVGSAISGAVSGFNTGNFLSGVAVMFVGSLLSPKPRIPNTSTQQTANENQLASRSVMSKQPITSRETVYGESKKSGAILSWT